jgi:hypothetical protein
MENGCELLVDGKRDFVPCSDDCIGKKLNPDCLPDLQKCSGCGKVRYRDKRIERTPCSFCIPKQTRPVTDYVIGTTTRWVNEPISHARV